MKTNCWEFTNCGRQPGGLRVKELGVCQASVELKVNGVNSGKNGGRCCWAVTGTLCGSKKQGSYLQKVSNCMSCDFYKKVFNEEQGSANYKTPTEILKLLNS
jgi:hypothetical protein